MPNLFTRVYTRLEVVWDTKPLRCRYIIALARLRALNWGTEDYWLVDDGARDVLVNVEPGNEPARAFYAHQGAQEMNDHWMEWARLDRQLPAWPEGVPLMW